MVMKSPPRTGPDVMRPACWMGRESERPSQETDSRLTNGCAWNAVSAFANCGLAVAHVPGSYVPIAPSQPIHSITSPASASSLLTPRLLPLSRDEP